VVGKLETGNVAQVSVWRVTRQTQQTDCHITFSSSLGPKPSRNSLRTKADTGADPKGWDSTFLGELINDDSRNGEERGQLARSHGAPKSLDSIGKGLRVGGHPPFYEFEIGVH
jgi:hypothetical protein